ncbi:hypothetical protein [Streptomyces sp. NPDC088812]|uniref:hypothetical protein n=1 Tax=Streptomyces sp. NPDC088812 TaxID=3365905 RepID=UPI003801D988
MVGHRDRTASVTCSSACTMPPRSRDLAALRRFAEAHAAAHARAASVRSDAACWCRGQRCASHEGIRIACAGTVVLVLRHDPAVGQVWTLSEVCAACAALMPHTRVLGRAAPSARAADPPEARQETGTSPSPPEPASTPTTATTAIGPPRLVPGGFSAPGASGAGGGTGPERPAGRRRGRLGHAPRRGRTEAEGGGR